MPTHVCVYQGVRNRGFLENFALYTKMNDSLQYSHTFSYEESFYKKMRLKNPKPLRKC